ncbi:phage portal protein [Tuwongella immobilis]|uniref:Phage portal protein n=1 Tax=Tuwongella immobilis TaxID=692036 RepID=A0A6C2YRH6_9BACT|nr:phage portal protein [Tuwongella immobilis]VIP03961.1 Phage portal protein, HK97 OS=Planctomyces maris DSM 8797 GN=PM8797T_10819 PE=4 SV=1: Phage_portal [Tuwongella immobilis]VTS05289.1 Phage portal protein, HK97 OS=Planctomyces maris DSM 8797 GN=PM8797T_10819 PE=4 SV=1: Phage_portal [Tuwongella immobilis]
MGKRSAIIRVWDALRFGAKAAADAFRSGKSPGERQMAGMLGGFRYGTTLGGWTGNPLEQIRHYNHWVYRAIDCIGRMVATHPPSVARISNRADAPKGMGTKRINAANSKRVPIHARKKALTTLMPHEELEYLDSNHPLVRLLRDPNEPDTGGDLWRELIMFLELTGLGYLWPVENGAGQVCELWVMPSHWVFPVSLGKDRLIDYYEIRPFDAASGGRAASPAIFDADDLIAFRYKSPLSKTGGHAPMQAGAEIIDVYESIQASRFFACKHGANVGSVIQIPTDINPTDQDIRRIEEQWFQRFAGETGFDRPMILPPGATLSRPPGDHELAYIQSADQMRDYVLGIWGITKSIAGFVEDVNRAAFIAAMSQFCSHVINPRTHYIGDVLSEKLCPRFDSDLRAWWDDLTPSDPDTERSDTEMLLRNGCMTPNEARSRYGLEPYEHGGDDPLVAMGLAPLPLNTGEIPDETLLRQPDPHATSETDVATDADSDGDGLAQDADLNADVAAALRHWRCSPKGHGAET